MTTVTPQSTRSRHRAQAGGRGWGPRALLQAMAAPLGVAVGLGAVVAGAIVDPMPWVPAGAAFAGASGMLGSVRSRSRRRRRALARRERRARLLTAPLPPLVWESGSWDAGTAPHADLRIDTQIDTVELQRIWDAGDGPDTGPIPAVPDAPIVIDGQLVTEAPEGKQAVLLTGIEGAGRTHVLAPVITRRPRIGTTEARVFDALARAEADELTWALELPTGRGRHAAAGPVDGRALPAGPSAAKIMGSQPGAVRRRGRHAA